MSSPAQSVKAFDPGMTGDWTRALFEAIDDAVFVHDADGNILEANPAACRRLGYTRAELLQFTTRDIDDPEFAAGFESRLQAQLDAGIFRCEGRHRTKDGRIVPVDINTSAVELNGKPAVLAVMRDITQQKQTEETLARQGDLLQSILNNMGDAVLVAGKDRKLIACNPAAQRLFSMGPANTGIGRAIPTEGLFLSDKTSPVTDDLNPLVRSIAGEDVDGAELFLRTPQAPAGLWISVNGRPLRDAKGNIKGGVIVCHDFTERRRAASRLSAQYAVATALAESDNIAFSARRVLQVLCESLGLEVGILWVVNPSENCLTCLEYWHAATISVPQFLTATRLISLDADRDVPGQAWSSGNPAELTFDGPVEGLPLRCALAQREGLRASYAFPIEGANETAGVIEFLSRSVEKADDDWLILMKAIASQIGQVLERQRIEEALRDSEALYHSLVQSLPQNIFRKDRDGKLTFGNKHYCETLKQSQAELLGKTDFDLFPAELAAKYVEDDRRVLEKGEIFEAVEAHHLAEGGVIYVQVVKTPIYDAQGNIIGIQGIFWDVTERKRSEDILAESERRYRQLTEATLDGIVLVDHSQIIRLFNPAAERMFGYKANEVVGQPASLLVPVELKSTHEQAFWRYIDTRDARLIGKTVELRGLRKDGTDFPVEISLNAVPLWGSFDSEGRPIVQFLAAFRDLTERNKMRSVLIQNEKLASIGLLSAGVAHEINNPLAFVANNLVVLERDCRGLLSLVERFQEAKDVIAKENAELAGSIGMVEEQIDFEYVSENLGRLLQRTREGVDRVTKIVHSLRGLARTDAVRHQEIHIPDLIENSLEILRGRFKRSGIEVVQDHDPEPRVTCVHTQISQVILNLLVNSFQAVEGHRPEGGRVDIRTRRIDEEMLIEIGDNGPGIDAEHQAKLFDPFFTTKDVGEGTGLGLSISHNIIVNHGGRIEVDSAPGEGARFRIYLPLKQVRDKA